ncbi:hypothetical protein N7535_001183 [Penicillium sp. DV-2018c]|nr:hypothetical protein N7535_001183 [Penicillium sp. DV-2018c]
MFTLESPNLRGTRALTNTAKRHTGLNEPALLADPEIRGEPWGHALNPEPSQSNAEVPRMLNQQQRKQREIQRQPIIDQNKINQQDVQCENQQEENKNTKNQIELESKNRNRQRNRKNRGQKHLPTGANALQYCVNTK